MAGSKAEMSTLAGGQQQKKKKSCCGGRCWMIVAIIAIILLIISTGGIAGLIRLLKYAVRPLDFVEAVKDCTECPKCHLCLAGFTGQDVPALCEVDNLNRVLQCAAQVYYLYSPERRSPNIPCYDECSACRNCIDKLSLDSFERLTTTLWQTVYPQFFTNTTEIDPNQRCNITCITRGDITNCQWICLDNPNQFGPNQIGQRRKRDDGPIHYESDRDACCGTERSYMPYLDTSSNGGKIWYPVWFHDPFISPPSSFQEYSKVKCPQNPSSCDSNIICLEYQVPQTFLMSTMPPNQHYGYTYIILSYPNSMVKFITVELAAYCRCTV